MNTDDKSEYLKTIQTECNAQGFDPDLLSAIINAESSWNSKAMRYEKNYGYLWQPPKYAIINGTTTDTETVLQKISYGLAQIIGANCRWLGFEGGLFEVLDPILNIKLAADLFKKRCDIHKEIKDKISAYNAGSPIKDQDGNYLNSAYVEKVYSYYSDLKKPKT